LKQSSKSPTPVRFLDIKCKFWHSFQMHLGVRVIVTLFFLIPGSILDISPSIASFQVSIKTYWIWFPLKLPLLVEKVVSKTPKWRPKVVYRSALCEGEGYGSVFGAKISPRLLASICSWWRARRFSLHTLQEILPKWVEISQLAIF